MKKLIVLSAVVALGIAGNSLLAQTISPGISPGNLPVEKIDPKNLPARDMPEKAMPADMKQKVKEMTAQEKAIKVSDKLEKKLSLNSGVKEQVLAILGQKFAAIEALRMANPGNLKAILPKIKAINKDSDMSIKKLLNADQIAKFDAMKAKAKGKRKGAAAMGDDLE